MFRSLCRQPYRSLDAICRGIASRVGGEIDDAQLRLMGGMNGVTERLFVTVTKAGRRRQIDTVAVGARDAGSSLQPNIKLARAGRLTEIEARGANGYFDGDLITCGLDDTRERGARDHSSEANEGLSSESGVHVHVDLQVGY
jgi:hypothetical protein